MSDTKWTPGEWFLFGNGHCVGGAADTPAGTGGIGMFSMNVRSPEENTANATLCVAAPDLYEALERLITEHGMALPVRCDALKNARAVLARARGEACAS